MASGRVLQDLNGFDLDIASYTSQIQIYDTLLTYDSDGKPVPRLAESWTIAPDGSSATIKLRQGATFQNGKPVNADAILANYQKALDSKFAFQIFSIVPRIKDLTKTDDLTLQLTMQGATPERVITDILDSINIMEPSTLDTDYLKTKAIGAGPFAVDSYNPNNQLTLKRYDGFWKKPGPSLQQIVYHLSNDIDAQVASLQAGANDIVSFLPPNYTARLKDQFDIFQGPAGTEVYPFRLNPSMAPFDNKGIRQGLQYAINRQGIVDKVFYGYARPQALPFGQTGPAYETEIVKNYPFDLQKAKQMFQAAGAHLDRGPVHRPGRYDGLSIGQIVQADLATIGVKLDMQQISSVESGQHAFAGDYQMSYGILGNCGKYPTWVTLNSLMRVQNNPVLKDSAAPILDRWQKAIAQLVDVLHPFNHLSKRSEPVRVQPRVIPVVDENLGRPRVRRTRGRVSHHAAFVRLFHWIVRHTRLRPYPRYFGPRADPELRHEPGDYPEDRHVGKVSRPNQIVETVRAIRGPSSSHLNDHVAFRSVELHLVDLWRARLQS